MTLRCGKCQNCLDLEQIRRRVLACCSPPFTHLCRLGTVDDYGVVNLWNTELTRLPCTDQPEEKLHPLPDYGDHMTLGVFIDNVLAGIFIDYDGHGVYATNTQVTCIEVVPSDVRAGRLHYNYTHVMWFNR
jgi:hypothetical protein